MQKIHSNGTYRYNGGGTLLQTRASPPAGCVDACEQLSRVERFEQVVIHARLQAANFILHIFTIGHHDDQCIMYFAQLTAQREYIDVLECGIKKDQIRLVFYPLAFCLLSCICAVDLVSERSQPTG